MVESRTHRENVNYLPSDHLDDLKLLRSLCASDGLCSGIIVFYTGIRLPDYLEQMPREPLPSVGDAVDQRLEQLIRDAITLNSAIHDGAILCGRSFAKLPYQITGWSYRLFPPSGKSIVQSNKGSAFNSSYAMSFVSNVDKVFFWSAEHGWLFKAGQAIGPIRS